MKTGLDVESHVSHLTTRHEITQKRATVLEGMATSAAATFEELEAASDVPFETGSVALDSNQYGHRDFPYVQTPFVQRAPHPVHRHTAEVAIRRLKIPETDEVFAYQIVDRSTSSPGLMGVYATLVKNALEDGYHLLHNGVANSNINNGYDQDDANEAVAETFNDARARLTAQHAAA